MQNNALVNELDTHITRQLSRAANLRERVEELRSELLACLEDLERAFGLYHSITGAPHPDRDVQREASANNARPQPRVVQVMTALSRRQMPVSLDEVVEAMPDAPDRGAVSAALHRAVKQGIVRRVKRGVYELADESWRQRDTPPTRPTRTGAG